MRKAQRAYVRRSVVEQDHRGRVKELVLVQRRDARGAQLPCEGVDLLLVGLPRDAVDLAVRAVDEVRRGQVARVVAVELQPGLVELPPPGQQNARDVQARARVGVREGVNREQGVRGERRDVQVV